MNLHMKKRTVQELNDLFVCKKGSRFKDIPRKIEIETINRCNGKCAFCPVNVNEPQRKYAKMTEELFEKIIHDLCELNYRNKISLFSNNEPFLDERIIDWHRYAKNKLPKAYFVLFTNGTLLTLSKMIELMNYCDKLVIDNYSDEGDINDSLVEIREYLDKEDKYKDRIFFEIRSESEILTSRGGFAPNKGKSKTIDAKCALPFQQMVIRPTGEVSLCCNDALGKMTLGDCNIQSIKEIWFGEKYRVVREKMMYQGRKGLDLCCGCDTLGGDYTYWETHYFGLLPSRIR